MLSSHNILSPANGAPIVTPTQDQVLGCYYLTKAKVGEKGENRVFSCPAEVISAYNSGAVGLQARIGVRINGKLLETTVGKVIFNDILPAGMPYQNQLMRKKELVALVSQCYRQLGKDQAIVMLDKLKDLGFEYATQAGISISISDMRVPVRKGDLIGSAEKEIIEIEQQYLDGIITDGERYNKVIDIWSHITE